MNYNPGKTLRENIVELLRVFSERDLFNFADPERWEDEFDLEADLPDGTTIELNDSVKLEYGSAMRLVPKAASKEA